MRIYQCAVMGTGGVGKSSITVRFVNGSYLESYDPTIEDSYRKQISVDGKPCLLEILDTAGVDQFVALNDLFIRESEAFVLVFGINQRDSFQDVVRLREMIFRVKPPMLQSERLPIVIVGNKSDLEDEREVDKAEVQAATRNWQVKYFETSARYDVNITTVFQEIVRQLRHNDLVKGVRQGGKKRYRDGKKCIIL